MFSASLKNLPTTSKRIMHENVHMKYIIEDSKIKNLISLQPFANSGTRKNRKIKKIQAGNIRDHLLLLASDIIFFARLFTFTVKTPFSLCKFCSIKDFLDSS